MRFLPARRIALLLAAAAASLVIAADGDPWSLTAGGAICRSGDAAPAARLPATTATTVANAEDRRDR